MNLEHVETFLAVVNAGSIIGAAERLYLSQSTVSTRIRQLEEELGAELLLRQRGHRVLDLTPYGQAFIPLAHQWVSLWETSQSIKDRPLVQDLSIASVDAVNSYGFIDLFNEHLTAHPEIKLRIRTHHSDEIHSLVANHIVDLGFVFRNVQYQDVISKPVYRELMYLICHKDSSYHEEMEVDKLDPALEIFLDWGPEYMQWHNRHMGGDDRFLMQVNTGSMLQHYLHVPGRWAIAPMSVVQQFQYRSDLVSYKLDRPPAPRICYELVHRYPKPSHRQAIETFEEEMTAYILRSRNICHFEPWMLEE